MVNEEVTNNLSDDTLRELFDGLFELVHKGQVCTLTPEMEATLNEVLSNDDLVAAIPWVVDLAYRLFLKREIDVYYLDKANAGQYSLDFQNKVIGEYKTESERNFDPYSLKMQALKLKEITTDRVVFI